MSTPNCGTHNYGPFDRTTIDKMIQELNAQGYTVTGNNPWNIDTHKYSIKLQATWNPATCMLAVTVTDKSVLVPCSKIWDVIDPLLHHISQLSLDTLTMNLMKATDGKSLCGSRVYGPFSTAKIDAMLQTLRAKGFGVSGDNPWVINTHNHGVILQGSWDPSSGMLTVIVTAKAWYVPCSKIWETVDPLLRHIPQLSVEMHDMTLMSPAEGQSLCGTRVYGPFSQSQIDNAISEMRSHGYKVTGNNPWVVDTKNHGVILQGTWSPVTGMLSVIVIAKDWYVPCSEIWKAIDSILHPLSLLLRDKAGINLLAAAEGNSLCGTHVYGPFSQAQINAMLQTLRDKGFEVRGNNPWVIDTHNHGVILQGSWDPTSGMLSVIVTAKDWYVPCSKIWNAIDPILHHISTLSIEEVGAKDMAESSCGTRVYGPFSKDRIDAMINSLKSQGYGVSGNNPWDIDTHHYGVKLRGAWDPTTGMISVTVTAKAWYVPCSEIWKAIDPSLHYASMLSDEELNVG